MTVISPNWPVSKFHKTVSKCFSDGWKSRWAESKHKSDYGQWKLTSGKFYGDAELDKGERSRPLHLLNVFSQWSLVVYANDACKENANRILYVVFSLQVCRPVRTPAFTPCPVASTPSATRVKPWWSSSRWNTSRRSTAAAATWRSSPPTRTRPTCTATPNTTSCSVSR